MPKEILGGKWYLFANYEGFRFPNSSTVTKAVPSPGMKLGLLQFNGVVYNLNPGAVTYPSDAPAIGVLVPGQTYAGSGTTLDPRGWVSARPFRHCGLSCRIPTPIPVAA